MKSVTNTLTIVELVAAHQPVSLAELCEQLDLPKTTIQRSLTTLKQSGWIKPDSPTGNPRWILSNKFLSLHSQNHLARLSQLARPFLQEIRDKTGETTFLSAYDIDRMTVIDYIDSTHPVRLAGGLGGNIPAHCSSTGKACLATLADNTVLKILKGNPDYTVDADQLLNDLARIRQQGIAIIQGEWSEELSHIGCAIVDAEKQAMGGIGISVPNYRFNELDIEATSTMIKNACKRISEQWCDQGT